MASAPGRTQPLRHLTPFPHVATSPISEHAKGFADHSHGCPFLRNRRICTCRRAGEIPPPSRMIPSIPFSAPGHGSAYPPATSRRRGPRRMAPGCGRAWDVRAFRPMGDGGSRASAAPPGDRHFCVAQAGGGGLRGRRRRHRLTGSGADRFSLSSCWVCSCVDVSGIRGLGSTIEETTTTTPPEGTLTGCTS